MTDVKNLRRLRYIAADQFDYGDRGVWRVLDAAADELDLLLAEIERLQAEVAELKARAAGQKLDAWNEAFDAGVEHGMALKEKFG